MLVADIAQRLKKTRLRWNNALQRLSDDRCNMSTVLIENRFKVLRAIPWDD